MTPQEFFKNDLFAENAGVVLLEVREGYSKAKLEIKPEHLNAGARTQGGAIFTLADLALAAAANSHGTCLLYTSHWNTFTINLRSIICSQFLFQPYLHNL